MLGGAEFGHDVAYGGGEARIPNHSSIEGFLVRELVKVAEPDQRVRLEGGENAVQSRPDDRLGGAGRTAVCEGQYDP